MFNRAVFTANKVCISIKFVLLQVRELIMG